MLDKLLATVTPAVIERVLLLVNHVIAAEPAAGERLRRYLHETPHEEDVRRVAARLAAGGWPLIQAPEPLQESPGTLSQADGTPPTDAPTTPAR